MGKVFKEIAIILLLLIAVGLVLAVLLYDYIPSNKTVPIEIKAYSIPEDIKEELNNNVSEEQSIVRTYYIDNSDLDLYESSNDYDKGKANPFAQYKTNEQSIQNNSTTNSTNSNNTDNKINTNNEQQQGEEQNKEVYINTPGKNY